MLNKIENLAKEFTDHYVTSPAALLRFAESNALNATETDALREEVQKNTPFKTCLNCGEDAHEGLPCLESRVKAKRETDLKRLLG